MNYIEFAKNSLKEAGYKLTTPRLKVLEVLSQSPKPISPYEMGIDPSTAYRILEVYEKLNLVHYHKNIQRYTICQDFSCSNKKHCHHQFTCENCQQVQELHIEDHSFLKTLTKKFQNFEFQSHYFEFSGLCQNCKNR